MVCIKLGSGLFRESSVIPVFHRTVCHAHGLAPYMCTVRVHQSAAEYKNCQKMTCSGG
jgi:hypothetical protein